MATEIEMLSSESSKNSDKMEDPSPDSGNLSRKVVGVAAGEAHTLALLGDGCVYSWGRGMFGRLGIGSEEDELFPVRAKFGSPGKLEGDKLKFVGVAAGAYHNLALADDGSVWSWGYNLYGQLGFDGENTATPRLLERFLELGSPYSSTEESETKSKTPLKVSSVKAGGMMSLAIDNLGTLWLWGNCPQQSTSDEAVFSLMSSFTPTPVFDFYGHTVVKVACGNEHVIAVVTVGETYRDEDLVCYTWGNNNHGQLGLGDTKSRSKPQILETFSQDSSWEVYEVSCGAFHTALLTHRKKPSDVLESMCWTFGLGENGQLGHGTTQSSFSPEPLKKLPPSVYLISIDCGLFHTSVVSSAGDVWSWGMEKGLGLCPDASFTGTDAGDAVHPLLVSQDTRFSDPVQIACGAAHTVLVAHDGYKIWSWGRGRSGVLGNGRTNDFYTPTVVLWPPLSDDFKQEELNDDLKPKDPPIASEIDDRLSSAMENMKLAQSKLQTMERYASILHGSLFGKPFEEQDIPMALRNTGSFDIGLEWEKMLESADRVKLSRLEMFYRNMLAGVKDKLLKKRIQELIRESLPSSSTA